jgi:hypothetical protein
MGEILISITNYFISIPVSPANPLTPAFVGQAFDFTRTLVNGLFLLILVFIGLATILRLQNYPGEQVRVDRFGNYRLTRVGRSGGSHGAR